MYVHVPLRASPKIANRRGYLTSWSMTAWGRLGVSPTFKLSLLGDSNGLHTAPNQEPSSFLRLMFYVDN